MSFRKLVRQIIQENSILQEGPIEKMQNSGVPPQLAKFIYEFLPDNCKEHSLWFVKQLAKTMHQFEDNIKIFKQSSKIFKKTGDNKEKARAKVAIQILQQVISDKSEDISLICNWTERTKINLSKAKFIEIVTEKGSLHAPSEKEKVPLTIGSAVEAARQFFDMSDGEVILELANGWYWLDRKTSSCSVEAAMMGHCGQSDNSDSTLVSLRDSQGFPHITVELEETDEGDVIHQVKGKANSTPDKKYWSMIFDLMKSNAVNLYQWSATGAHGGDLEWEMIPEEEQEAIQEANPNFVGAVDSKEQKMEKASEEVEEAVNAFEHDVLNAWGDVDWVDGENFYARIDVGGQIILPEKVVHALDAYGESVEKKHRWEKPHIALLKDLFSEFDLPVNDLEEPDHTGTLNFSIEDSDLMSPDTTEVINNLSYYENNSITESDFIEKLIEQLIDHEVYDIGMNKIEDLQLQNFEVAWDGEGEEAWVLASTEVGPLPRNQQIDYEALTKEFIKRIVDTLSSDLSQLILPHVEFGKIQSLTPYPEAALAPEGNDAILQFKFTTLDDNSFSQGIDLMKAVDSNIDAVRKLYHDMLSSSMQEPQKTGSF